MHEINLNPALLLLPMTFYGAHVSKFFHYPIFYSLLYFICFMVLNSSILVCFLLFCSVVFPLVLTFLRNASIACILLRTNCSLVCKCCGLA